MNNLKPLHYLTLLFILVLSPVSHAASVLSATDGDINFYNADNLFGDISYQLFLFDNNTDINNNLNPSTGLRVFLPSIVGVLGPIGNDYIATNQSGNTLLLQGSGKFILALYDSNDQYWLDDIGFTPVSSANGVVVNFFDSTKQTSVSILASDVISAVPLPPSFWLFLTGSSIIAVINRKHKKHRRHQIG